MTVFEGAGLAAMRGGRLVFAELGFRVESGGALLLTGPNGSGKSTLLRLMAGLLRPQAGRIQWAGEPADTDRFRTDMAYLGHRNAVKPALSARANLRFWCRLHSVADGSDEALDRLGLAEVADLPASYLSAGQTRRLALARLLAVPTKLWLLDEPAAGLDAASAERLAELMRQHSAAGGLVVVASHGDVALDRPAVLALPDFAA